MGLTLKLQAGFPVYSWGSVFDNRIGKQQLKGEGAGSFKEKGFQMRLSHEETRIDNLTKAIRGLEYQLNLVKLERDDLTKQLGECSKVCLGYKKVAEDAVRENNELSKLITDAQPILTEAVENEVKACNLLAIAAEQLRRIT